MPGYRDVPFLVGITGHRDLRNDEKESLANAVTAVLQHYQMAMPNTEIVLVSGLAIGADQVAAESALSLPGVRVIGVLPMSVDEYRRDFEGVDLDHFENLLSQCSGVIDASQYLNNSNPDDPDYRDALYQNAGRFIARNCPVMIAAWDGAAPEYVGGTADIVYFKCAELIPLRSPYVEFNESPVDPGTVLHCPANRVSRSVSSAGDNKLYQLSADGKSQSWDKSVQQDMASLDTLNQNLRALSDAQFQSTTQRLLEASDLMAVELQRHYRNLLKTLLLSGVLALTLIGLMQTIEGRWSALPASVGLVLLGSLWWYFQRSALKARFQAMRALAEGARVQFVWQTLGIRESVAEDYLAGQSGAAAWIRQTLRGAYLVDQASSQPLDSFVATNWIHEQVRYFRGTVDRPGAIQRTLLKAVAFRRWSLAVAGLAVLALFADIAAVASGLVVPEWLRIAIHIIWSVGLAITIALVSYSEIMGFKQLSARYSVAAPIFEQGEAELARLGLQTGISEFDVRAVVQVVGRRALRESGDWFALHAGREVRPV